jgi:uncharacterized membrane protein
MITIFKLMNSVIDLINKLIYIIIGLALVGFLWGIVKILFSGGNEKIREEGRKFTIYGILTLFVMTSMWSIVYLMKDFLGNDYTGDVQYQTDSVNSNQQTDSLQDASDLFENNNDQQLI